MGVMGKLVSGIAGSRAYRLCKAAGLTIEESDGDSTVLSFGGDHVTPRRVMFVADVDDDLTLFDAYVRGTFPAYSLPDHLLLGLMTRSKWAGAWTARLKDGGQVKLAFQYSALSKGLDAAMVQVVCRTIIREVAEVELLLASHGLL